MLIVALVLTLNNFLFAMNPKAAKPIFDWIDPFVIIGLALVFIDKILDSMKTKPNGNRLMVAVLAGALAHLYAYITWPRWRAAALRAEPCGW